MTGSIGPYLLLRLLGQGGMGETFLVAKTGPNEFLKLFVLKRIRPEYASHPDFVRRFINEAKLTAFFSHDNLVDLVDFGMDNGQYYLVLEYVRGWNLREVIQTATANGVVMPPSVAAYIAMEFLRGLHHAHTAFD